MRHGHHGHGPSFTHFGSLPFISLNQRNSLKNLQTNTSQALKKYGLDKYLKPNNPNLFHLTLMMLFLGKKNLQQKMNKAMMQKQKQITQIMANTVFTTGKIGYFTRRPNRNSDISDNYINVIYLDLIQDDQYKKMEKLVDYLIRLFVKEEIIFQSDFKQMNIEYDHNKGAFKNKKPHITLFKCDGLYESKAFKEIYLQIQSMYKGKKIIVESVDISTRFQYEESKFYQPLYRIQIPKFQEKM